MPGGLSPMLTELGEAIGGNLQIVPIDGFDELMAQLAQLSASRSAVRPGSAASGRPDPTTLPFDMQVVDGATLDDLDWARVQTQIVAYCRGLWIRVPTPVDRAWLVEQMYGAHLLVREGNAVEVTVAGYLLFANRPTDRLPSARCIVRVEGEPDRVLDGNLWSQLDGVMAILDEANEPFRLKGSVSEDVYPYPPLALKEVVVNALAHRRYDAEQSVVVDVTARRVSIVNPGGLVEDVLQNVERSGLQERIERGARGIKGYRNHVLADVLYGAGAMDKRGSGLADVQAWVRQNNGAVRFGPAADNARFEVDLDARPEAVDEVTRTAHPVVPGAIYVSNLLEVLALPPVVWHGGTDARAPGPVWKATGATDLPPFILRDKRLYTFSDLTDRANPLSGVVDRGDVEELSLGEFTDGEEGERRLVSLLNPCLARHLDRKGLVVDKKRLRAYFPRTVDGPREITYQARARRATRTVTKPIVSRTTQQVRYWEHESVRFDFERYRDAWSLQVLPGYVFTTNGWRRLVDSPRVGALATRRASRDYNPNVNSDLVFWTWVVSGGEDNVVIDTGGPDGILLRGTLASCEVRDAPGAGAEPTPDNDARLDMDELEEQLGEIADEIGEDDDAARD